MELDPDTSFGKRVARALRYLDWLARFRVEARAQARLRVTDRHGGASLGLGALAALARGIPLLFPLWLPLAAMGNLWTSASSGPASGKGLTKD